MTHLFAYLDPGSSSMIVQMLLGGFAAVGVALKLYWRRFKRMLGIGKKDPEEGLYTSSEAADEQPTVTVNGSEPAREPAGKR